MSLRSLLTGFSTKLKDELINKPITRSKNYVNTNVAKSRAILNRPVKLSPTAQKGLEFGANFATSFAKAMPGNINEKIQSKLNIPQYNIQTGAGRTGNTVGNIASTMTQTAALGGALKPLFSSITNPALKLAGNVINKGGIANKVIGKGIGNVAQGLPYTAAYRTLDRTNNPKPATLKGTLGDTAFDFATGMLPIIGMSGLTREIPSSRLVEILRSGKGSYDSVSGLVKMADGAGNQVNLGRLNKKTALEATNYGKISTNLRDAGKNYEENKLLEGMAESIQQKGNGRYAKERYPIGRENLLEAPQLGYKDIRGSKAGSAEEIAPLLKDFRNPKEEVFHVVYTKNGKVVAHNAMGQNLPDAVGINPKEITYGISNRADRLNADAVYIAHNHPSGDATPSNADIQVLNKMRDIVGPRLKGELVIDHDKVSIIDKGFPTEVTMDLGKSYQSIGTEVSNPDVFERLVREHWNPEDNKLGLFIMNSKLKPVGYENFSISGKSTEQINSTIRQFVRKHRGSSALGAMNIKSLNNPLGHDIKNLGLSDLLLRDENLDRYSSLSRMGVVGHPGVNKLDLYKNADNKNRWGWFFDKPIKPSGVKNLKATKPEQRVKIETPKSLSLRQQTLPQPKPSQIFSLSQGEKPLKEMSPQITKQTQGILPPTSGKKPNQTPTESSPQKISYNSLDRLYTEFVDRFHPISKLAKKAGKDADTRRAIASYYGSGSTADYHLNQELSPILRNHDMKDLKEAAIAMRDVELANRGIKGSTKQADAVANLTKLQQKLGPEKMREVGVTLQKLYGYQDSLVKRYLVDTGVMSAESYSKMRQNNQFYIPFKRVMDTVDDFLGIPPKKGAGSVGKQNIVQNIKGSEREILDPIESIVENTYKLVSFGRRQELANTISKIGKELPDVVTKVAKSDQRNTISVFENGKKVFYEVPEEVADAARGMGEEQLVTLTKILKVPTDMFRTMTTGINPEFLFPNISRDVQSALFNTGLNPVKWVAGVAHYLKQDEVFKNFMKAGGRTSRVSINRQFLKQSAEEVAGQSFAIKSPKDIIRGAEMLSQVSEQPTRIAVFEDAYKRSIKEGLSEEEALKEAAYWAQEGTVNFARRGSKMSNINSIYAYLNARIQGIDRMVRTAKKNPGKAAVRWGFGMLAPSLALYSWNNSGDREKRYNDPRILSDRDKQDNFIVMLPKPRNGVEYLKIPKSEIAKVVNPVDEFLDYARGKGGNVASSVGALIKSFSPIDNWGGTIPTAITPFVENAMNKDFYTGYDLVPSYKQNLPAGYQDSSFTSPLFRMAGQKLGVSPAKMQNLAESYGGGLVRVAEMATQPLIPDRYVSAKNEQGAEINRTPVLRRFMGGEKKSEFEQAKADDYKADLVTQKRNAIVKGMLKGEIDRETGNRELQKLNQQGGQVRGTSYQSESEIKYLDENGTVKTVKKRIEAPKLTSNTELNKKLISRYKSDLTDYANYIMYQYESGSITEEQAGSALEKIKAINSYLSDKTKAPKKAKQVNLAAISQKILKPVSVQPTKVKFDTFSILDEFRKAKAPDLTPPKIERPKFKKG